VFAQNNNMQASVTLSSEIVSSYSVYYNNERSRSVSLNNVTMHRYNGSTCITAHFTCSTSQTYLSNYEEKLKLF
jgi:hypothetical protein